MEHIGLIELLAEWDAGKEVRTVSMGGLSEGYERAIHTAAFEIIRYWDKHPVDLARAEIDADYKRLKTEELDAGISTEIEGLGLSGAQFGAAMNVAAVFSRQGYQKGLAMVDPSRIISIAKSPTPEGDAR